MASWTLDQLTALETAIAQGASEVRYADKRVTYRSLAEMEQLRRQMRAVLYPANKSVNGRRRFAQHNKGIDSEGA